MEYKTLAELDNSSEFIVLNLTLLGFFDLNNWEEITNISVLT